MDANQQLHSKESDKYNTTNINDGTFKISKCIGTYEVYKESPTDPLCDRVTYVRVDKYNAKNKSIEIKDGHSHISFDKEGRPCDILNKISDESRELIVHRRKTPRQPPEESEP